MFAEMDFSLVADKLGNPALAIPIMFVAGVLTSLTPCVYPMIPITAGIVGGQNVGGKGRTRRTVVLTLAYVLGLALVYATLGLIAGLTGSMFGSISTNPWLYFIMANFLLIAGLAMLDVVHVPVPARFLIPTAGNGKASAAFGMGAASGLVAAPCSAPVMAGVLTWVGTTRNGGLGFVYLFVFSLGMTSLLIVIGLFAGSVTALPRSGKWMVWIKRAFAVILFGAAEYYLIQTGKLLI